MKCGSIIDGSMVIPVNNLFYEMQALFKNQESRREFENPTEPKDEEQNRN
jgi:hypothetical protein